MLTGAMRSDDAGAEGLGNLVSAVRVAAEPGFATTAWW